MPTWGGILTELRVSPNPAGPGLDFDGVRRKRLRQRHERTQRNTVRYASNWLNANSGAADASISLGETQQVASYFASAELHHSHSMCFSREMARSQGVLVDDLEADQGLQDAVLRVHHVVDHPFANTPAVKIVENHLGKSYESFANQVSVPLVQAPSFVPMPTSS